MNEVSQEHSGSFFPWFPTLPLNTSFWNCLKENYLKIVDMKVFFFKIFFSPVLNLVQNV
jgi:hypothetical protein